MIYILIICLFIIFILVCIVIGFYNKNNMLFEKLFKYEEIINKQGMNNHEYNNQLMVLSGYLDCKDLKNVKDYLKTIIKDHRTGEDYDVKQLSRLPKGGLKKLLHYKISKMEELGIDYFLEVREDFAKNIEKVSINNYSDLTKLFGILIDNSIDASKKEKSEIDIDLSSKDNCLLIIIKNEVKNFNIVNIGKKRYTTKGKGHGFGLQIVNKIIKRNNMIDVSFELKNKHLIQTIKLDIK